MVCVPILRSIIDVLIWRGQSLPYLVSVNHRTTWHHLFFPARMWSGSAWNGWVYPCSEYITFPIPHISILTCLSSHVCPQTWPLHVIMTLTANNWCMCAVRLSKHWLSSEMRAEDLQLLWLAWLQDMESVLIIASLQPRMILGCFSGL